MLIRRPGEELSQEAGAQQVLRVGEVLVDLLFNRSALGLPPFLAVQHPFHTGGFQVECRLQVLGGDSAYILSYHLLCVGVELSTCCRDNGGDLLRRQVRASSEHHVFLGVSHAGKTRGRFDGAYQVIKLDCGHGRKVIAHNHYPQPVLKGCADYIRCQNRWSASQGEQESAQQPCDTARCGVYHTISFSSSGLVGPIGAGAQT